MKYKWQAFGIPDQQFRRIGRQIMSQPHRIFAVALSLALAFFSSPAQPFVFGGSSGEAEIRVLLDTQTAAWNRGDIESFMTGYWKSDQTEFVSANGIARGWQALLDRYHRSYPDRKAMGRLTFSNLEIHIECPEAAFAIGQFQLERENDRPAGVFTLTLRKFPEGWRIVADHTTPFAASMQTRRQ
jgi:Domain of unknown function (DUF4440)